MLKIAYLGSKALGLALLKALYTPYSQWHIIHPDDSNDPRSDLPSFNSFARSHGLDMEVAASPAAADAILRAFAPDIAFVCGWYFLLKPEILEIARLGFWGAHNSILPTFRGASPLVWAVMNGETSVGSTVFRFNAGMDDGPILLQVRVAVAEKDHIGDILQRVGRALVDEVPGKWRQLLSGTAELTMQDERYATYGGQRKPEDGLIDWRTSAEVVRNFIRAQSHPYPGAFTVRAGVKINVLDAEVEKQKWYGTPGQVLTRSGDYVLVSCGMNSALRLTSVEIEGAAVAPRTAFPTINLRL